METTLCEDGSVLALRGPMVLNVLVLRNGGPDTDLARLGVTRAFSLLEELAKNKAVITTNITRLRHDSVYPSVVRKMIGAVLKTGDKDMTPLAAVAGAVSDEVGDFLFQQEGVTKVLVNNGGDIAIRLRRGQNATVGVNTDYSSRSISHVLSISDERCGVTTSGLGGRSFTKGIASAVVVRAETASVADALSTFIGNNTNAEDALIHRRLAEEVYPDTDIPGHWVTMSVGEIGESKIAEALERGMAAVFELHERGLTFETLIAVKGRFRMTDGMRACLRPYKEITHAD